MSFRRRVKYFLVHSLGYNGKNADKIIASGALSINGKITVQNDLLQDEDELKLGDEVVRPARRYRYYMLNKPRGLECTFSKKIKDNLGTVFPFDDAFFVAGRLDKDSEGLLLISDDGKWVNKVANAGSNREKEYEVEVDSPLNEEFVKRMSEGLDLGDFVTRPCKVRLMNDKSFSIVLTEGKNRQIRRMCRKLGYRVQRLKRIRIDKFYLSDLQNLNYAVLKL